MGQIFDNVVEQFLSDVLLVGCMHIELMQWLLFANRWSDS